MISVCMATYNGERYIKKQLESILKQLSSEDEIIISDDLSTDSTINIIKGIGDPRIKIFIHDSNNGYTPNFENALSKANGDIIFLSDQDDEWLDNKVEVVLKYLKEYDFVVSDCMAINENGEIIYKSRNNHYNIKRGFIHSMIKMRYLGCCMAFNRKVLKALLPFPKRYDLVEHDTWIASVSELYFKTHIIDEPLIYYRRHSNNTSDGGEGKGYSLFNKIIRRLYRLICIIKVKNRIKYNK